MQEYSSVTASSYDADSLTPLLNDKAAEGWNVVSIVSAGTNIVAYLSRDTDQLDMIEEAEAEILTEEAIVDEAAAEVAIEEAMVEDAIIEEAILEEIAAESVDEPAGWATAPEETNDVVEDSASDESLASLATEPDPVAAPVLAAATPAPEPEPTPEPAVPAGWYADPSGRFELRYWDGAAWTEHVSRAGQQFTDPPVA